jgi:hypothetical protein
MATQNTPFIAAYTWTPGFGTRYASPATIPANTGTSVSYA